MSSSLSLHARDDRRELAIRTLADRLVGDIVQTLPHDMKQEETSVALRPLSVDPNRLSRLPDGIRDDLSDWLSDSLGHELAKARMPMRTRERLLDVYGTLGEYGSAPNLIELLRKAGAHVEFFAVPNWPAVTYTTSSCDAVRNCWRAHRSSGNPG